MSGPSATLVVKATGVFSTGLHAIPLRRHPTARFQSGRWHQHVCRAGAEKEWQEPTEGDPLTQDKLAEMVRLQVRKQKVADFVEEEADKLRLLAEQAKVEAEELGNLQKDRSNLAFDSALADINVLANEFEEELKKAREETKADAAEFTNWQKQMAVDRSEGQFFKSLYQPETDAQTSKPLDPYDKEQIQQRATTVRKPAEREIRSPLRLYIFGLLSIILTGSVGLDLLSSSPSPTQDALYSIIAVLMGITAMQERSNVSK